MALDYGSTWWIRAEVSKCTLDCHSERSTECCMYGQVRARRSCPKCRLSRYADAMSILGEMWSRASSTRLLELRSGLSRASAAWRLSLTQNDISLLVPDLDLLPDGDAFSIEE
jgi:hypothetical protein